nr:hypothetical protein [Tanacetum cinerariifolium]
MFDTSIFNDEEVVAEKEVSTVDPVTTTREVVTIAVDEGVARNLEAQMQAELKEEETVARKNKKRTT